MTTTDTDALTERIRDEVYGTWISSCCDGAVINIDEAAEIAADLAPIIAVEVRKAKAEALREAAAWLDGFEGPGGRTSPYDKAGRDIIRMIRERATEYETGGSDDRR